MRLSIGAIGFGMFIHVLVQWLVQGEPVSAGTIAELVFAGFGLFIAALNLLRLFILMGCIFGLVLSLVNLVAWQNVWLAVATLLVVLAGLLINGFPQHGVPNHG